MLQFVLSFIWRFSFLWEVSGGGGREGTLLPTLLDRKLTNSPLPSSPHPNPPSLIVRPALFHHFPSFHCCTVPLILTTPPPPYAKNPLPLPPQTDTALPSTPENQWKFCPANSWQIAMVCLYSMQYVVTQIRTKEHNSLASRRLYIHTQPDRSDNWPFFGLLNLFKQLKNSCGAIKKCANEYG